MGHFLGLRGFNIIYYASRNYTYFITRLIDVTVYYWNPLFTERSYNWIYFVCLKEYKKWRMKYSRENDIYLNTYLYFVHVLPKLAKKMKSICIREIMICLAKIT